MTLELDVVIPTRNTRDLTLRCVEAVLRNASPRQRIRCVVVDNGSDDGTAEAIRERWPQAAVVRNETNTGFARACNQGVRAGSAELVLVLNSDAFPRPGALERLASYLHERPGHVAACGCLVEDGTNRPQVGFAVRGFPTLAAQVALMLGLERHWPSNPISRRQLMLDFDYGRTQDLEAQPAGACLLVRRDAFEGLGGFDEGYTYWFEDVDLVRRLRERGRIGYVHDAVFDHVGAATFGQWARPEVVRARYYGLLRYFARHHPRGETLVLRAFVALVAAVRAVALAPVEASRARAYADVVRLALRSRS